MKRKPRIEAQPVEQSATADAMNAYALRIWNGQSPDLPRATRVQYVQDGLRGQGWNDFTALNLPE